MAVEAAIDALGNGFDLTRLGQIDQTGSLAPTGTEIPVGNPPCMDGRAGTLRVGLIINAERGAGGGEVGTTC